MMHTEVETHIAAYPDAIRTLFLELRDLVLASAAPEPEEKLWAKLPSYYCGKRFVRLIPFRDHINVEAAAMPAHAPELTGYRLTPKGMLQIRLGQTVPADVLRAVFSETLLLCPR